MIYLIATLLFQVTMIVHVVRNGRNQLWIMAIAFLPLAGGVAYLIVEVLPGMGQTRRVRTARAAATRAIDPERELRAARDALDVADTLANRLRLGEALAELDRWPEALPVYEAAFARRIAGDHDMAVKLARARYETGDAAGALAILDEVPRPNGTGAADRIDFLRAKALGDANRADEALAIYRDIVTRMPGDEVRCRYAALLLALGRRREAAALLDEVAARAKRLPRAERRAQAAMYDWAETMRAQTDA